MKTQKTSDCIVIGAGVIGLTLARALSLTGRSVRIFDASDSLGAASWAGAGVLAPLYHWQYPAIVNRLAERSRALYPSLVAELRDSTGIDPEYRCTGLLVLDPPIAELGESDANLSSVAFPDISALSQHDFSKALWLPDVHQIRNPKLMKALRHDLKLRGALLHASEPVERLAVSEGLVKAVRTKSAEYAAQAVFVTAGSWSSLIMPERSAERQVRPIRGQMSLYKLPEALKLPVILNKGRYLVPRADGHLLVGSTVEDVGYHAVTTTEALNGLQRFAEQQLPILKRYQPVQSWAGLRPKLPDEQPYTGPVDAYKNLWLSTGHYRTGLTTAPASAELLLDQLNASRAV